MKHGKTFRRAGALLLVLALCALWVPVSAAETEYQDSGSPSYPNLSKQEIADLLDENPLTLPSQVFSAPPTVAGPDYVAGSLTDEALQAALNRLNALRRLAGLPPVELDSSWNEVAQHGAVLLASMGTLNHHPAKPADMDDSFYQKAYLGTSSGNLYAGRDLTRAVDGFMDDTDPGNIVALGHRRWQLNPGMTKVGFGYATNSNSLYRQFLVERVFENGSSVNHSDTCDYDFIAWPSSGNFPAQDGSYTLFSGNCAWSVTLNPDDYSTPSWEKVTVKLTRASDGKTWEFSSADANTSGKYFNVETSRYGVPNCIIFRPDGVSSYQGWYTVEIKGLAEGTLSYQVNFFNTDNAGEPDPSRYFSDVFTDDWYFGAVEYVCENGLMAGTGSGKFAPGSNLDRASTAALFYNLEGQPAVENTTEFTDVAGHWGIEAISWVTQNGVAAGLGGGKYGPGDSITREAFAVMLYKYAQLKGYDTSAQADLSAFPDSDKVSSWAQQALSWAVAEGLISGSGVPGGTLWLNPQDPTPRSQAASILMKYDQNVGR